MAKIGIDFRAKKLPILKAEKLVFWARNTGVTDKIEKNWINKAKTRGEKWAKIREMERMGEWNE